MDGPLGRSLREVRISADRSVVERIRQRLVEVELRPRLVEVESRRGLDLFEIDLGGRMDNRRAIAAGMTFRPLAVTAMDILAWWKEGARTEGASLRAGCSLEREREVVTAWVEGSRSS